MSNYSMTSLNKIMSTREMRSEVPNERQKPSSRIFHNSSLQTALLEASPSIDYLRDCEDDTAATEALSNSPSTSKPSMDDGSLNRELEQIYLSDTFDFCSFDDGLAYTPASNIEFNTNVEHCSNSTDLATYSNVSNEKVADNRLLIESSIHSSNQVQQSSDHAVKTMTSPGHLGYLGQAPVLSSLQRSTRFVDGCRDESSPLSFPTLSPPIGTRTHECDAWSGSAISSNKVLTKHPAQYVAHDSPLASNAPQYQLRILSQQQSKSRHPPQYIQPRPLTSIPQDSKYTSHASNWVSHVANRGANTNISASYNAQLPTHSRQVAQQVMSPTSASGTGISLSSARTPQEVLKTLLRKKACLYEPGTSQAIALITWLVGRGLALRQGYFTRQQLQSGVHNVVADKIENGFITRTKVNRCMQCILNSCFHYIIPRPDGTEEKGETFQSWFEATVVDDTYLLKMLPSPWDICIIDFDVLLDHVKDGEGNVGDFADEHLEQDTLSDISRRPVLLCFNDNVRSADDVLRCHNEFIRDAAISANLVLTAEEWRSFFVRLDDEVASTDVVTSTPLSPMSKVNGEKENCLLSLDNTSFFQHQSSKEKLNSGNWMKKNDYFGNMSIQELAKFRTEWCCKRYEHNHALCRFAHASKNEGWLRRDPFKYQYACKMCANVTLVKDDKSLLKGCRINACKNGVSCRFAHSIEEINFHPDHYKSINCESFKKNIYSCELRVVCPGYHSCDYNVSRNPRRHLDWSPRSKLSHVPMVSKQHVNVTNVSNFPEGAPAVYINPAPESEFEKSLLFPGMKGLFRRNCSSIVAYHFGFTQKQCHYSIFGDDWGLPTKELPVGSCDSHLNGFSLYSEM